MRELALHLLDLLQNAVEAGAVHVILTVDEDRPADRLIISVADDGRGMDAETAAKVTDPFYTTRVARHVGLGLPLLAMAAERAGGGMTIDSQPGVGTTVEATFRLSHPDRQPLGNLVDTLLAFLLSEKAPELRYLHRVQEVVAGGTGAASEVRDFEFDTADIRAGLGNVPLTNPLVAQWLTEFLTEGETAVCRDSKLWTI